MFVRKNFLVIVILLSVVFAVAMKATIFQKGPSAPVALVPTESAQFRGYWYTGQAELNSYSLQQTHFGVSYSGKALLIFETKDFRMDTQVESVSAESHDQSIPVLKTSLTKQVTTGLNDQSLVTSVFTPINSALFPATLKISSTMQAWDGITYTQVNFRNNGYQVAGHSYVESEADEAYRVDKVLLEDELYNRIRLNPAQLPTGSVELIPGAASARLRHKKLKPQPATITLQSVKVGDWFGALATPQTTADSLQAYTLDYTKDARKLTIVFDRAFPHQIIGWEETYADNGNRLTCKATLLKTVRSAYGSHRAPADSMLHRTLLP